jgi:hypothetical protein
VPNRTSSRLGYDASVYGDSSKPVGQILGATGAGVYLDNFDLRSPDGWALFAEMATLDIAERPSNVSKASPQQELE